MVSANDGKEELVKLGAFALISLFLIFENISMNFDENLKKEKRKKKKEKKSQNELLAFFIFYIFIFYNNNKFPNLKKKKIEGQFRGLTLLWNLEHPQQHSIHHHHKE